MALALAIAIHEIAAGVFPWRTQTIPNAPPEIVTIAHLTRIEHRPRPTPKPTPKPIVHTHVAAPTQVHPRIISPARPAPRQRIKRIASARAIARTHFHRKPVVHVPTGGQGAGTSHTAKAPTGSLGTGGSGTGQSGIGNGSGGAALAQQPCGYVDFQPANNPIIDAPTGRIWEHIVMTVHFPDGTSQGVALDYPWYYPSRAIDPFMPENRNIPATFQFPPAAQRAGEPPLVQYVMAHTTPDGYTLLRDCPGSAP